MGKAECELMVGDQTEIGMGSDRLYGYLYTPEENARNIGVLLLHGWTGSPNEEAGAVLEQKGYHTFTFSMRGHPPSSGKIEEITAKNSLDDAVAAYDFLRVQMRSDGPIVAVGNSYGAYIATLLSKKRTLGGLSLRVPAGYPDETFDLPKLGGGHGNPEIDDWRNQPHEYDTSRAFKALHDFPGKVQIMEAEHDDAVPHQTVENYRNAVADAANLEYHFLEGWPHSMGDNHARNEEFQGLLLDWLNRL